MTQSGPLYCYYGDDFTGSTDVLEALAAAGLRSVLFLGIPSDEHRRRFADCQAFGIAGDSRSRSPAWMNEHLPPIFAQLRAFGAPLIHYKTCSTFDSAPHVGSIGRAMEIGREALQSPFVPIVVAAPHLRRYVAFGNLFAASATGIDRIDRHPTMRCHPVTPMYEADLRRHLAAQTTLRVGLIDLPTLQAGQAENALSSRLAEGDEAILFDGVDLGDLAETGRLLRQQARHGPLFGVGSSGLTYSLIPAWRREGLAPEVGHERNPGAVESLLVMSGSCSPITERQITCATQGGYAGISVEPTELVNASRGAATAEACVREAITALRRSGKVVMYSALGPLSPGAQPHGDTLGRRMGAMLRDIIRATGVRRIVLAGGDTSSHAVSQLGIYALTWAASLQPGAPLCHTHAEDRELDGLELVLKGGQVGSDDFFERVRLGSF
jgi:uncharacterized protein YgbK (DUF1537 family)